MLLWHPSRTYSTTPLADRGLDKGVESGILYSMKTRTTTKEGTMSEYKVTSTINGKAQMFHAEAVPEKLFGKSTWEDMKAGRLLPFIVVEETQTPLRMVLDEGSVGRGCMGAKDGHSLPWQS